MSTSDFAIAIPIAILYSSFLNYAVDVVVGSKTTCKNIYYDEIFDSNSIETGKYDNYDQPIMRPPTSDELAQQKEDFNNCRGMKKREQTTRYVTLLFAGIFAIIAAGFVKSTSTAYGLALGGVFCILSANWRYWNLMDDTFKMISTGIALAILIVVSTQIYSKQGFFYSLVNRTKL